MGTVVDFVILLFPGSLMTGRKGHPLFPASAKDLQEPSKRRENSIVGLLSEKTGPHTEGILEEQGRPQSTAQEPLEGSGFPASRRCGSCKCDMNMLIQGSPRMGRRLSGLAEPAGRTEGTRRGRGGATGLLDGTNPRQTDSHRERTSLPQRQPPSRPQARRRPVPGAPYRG